MHNDLDHMLRALKDAPVDHALDGLAADVGERLAERRAAGIQTWGLRAAAVALVTMTGVVVSASTTASSFERASTFRAFASFFTAWWWTLLIVPSVLPNSFASFPPFSNFTR